MEDKLEQELESFTLEDIIREFSDHPEQEPADEIPVQAEEASGEETAEQKKNVIPEEISASAEEVCEEAAEQITETAAEEIPAEAVEEAADLVAEETAAQNEEAREGTTEEEAMAAAMSGATVRLDSAELLKGQVHNAAPIKDEEEIGSTETPATEATTEKASAEPAQWEPEYEEPMGRYVSPKPIAFPNKDELRQMKRKLVVGPEKKYYELSEKGLGKLQLAMFLTFLIVVLCAWATVYLAKGMVPESRIRLLIFSQFLAVLGSALLGSFQLIQGVADLFKRRFTLNTLLVITFLVCCADAVFCLLQTRIPCCAAFSLEMLMSLWATYHRRHGEMGQMDVLRKASRLNGAYTKAGAWEDKSVLRHIPGKVEHFMDHYDQVSAPERRQDIYAMIALVFSICIGVFTGLTKDLYVGIQMTAVSLLAAVPATAFVATTRPFAILQRRLHRLGAVLCGWQGVKQLCGKLVFPVRDEDIFPLGTTRMNGVKFFGSRPTEQVLAYATALVVADDSGLATLFQQVLDSRNGRHYDALELRHYENGGIGGLVMDEPVLVGPLAFLKDMGVEVPEGIQVSQAVCVAIDGEFSGVFAISYEKTRSATAGLSTLSSYRKLNPVMVTGEFMMSETFIRSKFGIKSKRLQFPDEQTRSAINGVEAEEDAQAALLTTMDGLAPVAYCVTGARALCTACNLGVALHMAGGIVGMLVVLALVILGRMDLLTPANMFLYQLVWMIPGWLLTEWTRSV